MDQEQYLKIARKYGDCASWAIWADVGATPKSNVGDLSIFNHIDNPALLDQLNPNIVIVGLNIARGFDGIFANFHDGKAKSQDYKIRYALKDTILCGAYMTDIIKYLPCNNSKEVMEYLRANPHVERENASKFEQELEHIGAVNPFIIALGGSAGSILNKYFCHRFEITQVTHYSHRVNKETYRKELEGILARF